MSHCLPTLSPHLKLACKNFFTVFKKWASICASLLCVKIFELPNPDDIRRSFPLIRACTVAVAALILLNDRWKNFDLLHFLFKHYYPYVDIIENSISSLDTTSTTTEELFEGGLKVIIVVLNSIAAYCLEFQIF